MQSRSARDSKRLSPNCRQRITADTWQVSFFPVRERRGLCPSPLCHQLVLLLRRTIKFHTPPPKKGRLHFHELMRLFFYLLLSFYAIVRLSRSGRRQAAASLLSFHYTRHLNETSFLNGNGLSASHGLFLIINLLHEPNKKMRKAEGGKKKKEERTQIRFSSRFHYRRFIPIGNRCHSFPVSDNSEHGTTVEMIILNNT